jgi:tRNA threonylcarbamoyladenosine biosynthesis protein TsaB
MARDGVRLLALETATLEVGAAVLEGDHLLAVSSSRPGRLHVETLHPAIERVLIESDTPPRDLDAVAVDVGPGLFTGLRVGIAAAKAFALALSIPVVAVRSTEAIREKARLIVGEDVGVIIPVVDMRRGEVAWELADGSLGIGAAETLASQLAGKNDVVLVGDGSRRLESETVASTKARTFCDEALLSPSVEVLGRIGVSRLRQGVVEDALSVEPVYLRAADAAANFETRLSTTATAGLRR